MNPFWHEDWLQLRARWRQWRALPEQSLWMASVLLMLGGLLWWAVLPVLRSPPEAVRAFWQANPRLVVALWTVVSGQQLWRVRRHIGVRAAQGWMASWPGVAHAERRYARAHLLGRAIVLAALPATLMLRDAPQLGWLWIAICAPALWALLLPLTDTASQTLTHRRRPPVPRPSRAQRPARFSDWQRAAASSHKTARMQALLALPALLLTPAGMSGLALIVSLIALFVLSRALHTQQVALAVLPRAQQWLASQPRYAAMRRELLRYPLWQGTRTIVVFVSALWLAGLRGEVSLLVGITLLGWLLLHALIHYRWRTEPRRVGISLSVHLVSWVLVSQVFSPALIPLALLQMIHQWRAR
jgi:hypothetical protein